MRTRDNWKMLQYVFVRKPADCLKVPCKKQFSPKTRTDGSMFFILSYSINTARSSALKYHTTTTTHTTRSPVGRHDTKRYAETEWEGASEQFRDLISNPPFERSDQYSKFQTMLFLEWI